MAYTRTDHTTAKPTTEGESPVSEEHASDLPPPQYPGGDHPRLVEEHHTIGPYGETSSKRPTSAGGAGITSDPNPAAATTSSASTTPGGSSFGSF